MVKILLVVLGVFLAVPVYLWVGRILWQGVMLRLIAVINIAPSIPSNVASFINQYRYEYDLLSKNNSGGLAHYILWPFLFTAMLVVTFLFLYMSLTARGLQIWWAIVKKAVS